MNGRILVVDDELGIRRGCQRALAPAGYVVETAVSLQEGRQKIEADQFDLVLLDVMMPDGRGMELLEPMLAQDPETVAIIITGYATVELAVEAIKRGAYDFVSKPFTADLLLMTVNQGMEKRRLSLEAKRLQAIEQEVAALTQAKEEMERLSEFKSRFTFIVAHELRAPVGGAQSLLRTLTRGLAGELTGKQREILQRIEARLDQLLALINDLLDLAESKTVASEEPLQAVAIGPLLREAGERFAAEAAQKQVKLHVQEVPEPLFAQGRADGVARILSNLLSNAIKYTPSGGAVWVKAEGLPPDKVTICVRDTGMGIPQDALSHIGEDFFRAENARQSGIGGTGLGLSIVHQLVSAYGGVLAVESSEGEGSVFRVELPGVKGS